MKLHEYVDIFPEMGEEDFNLLLEDIRENGQQIPITTHDGKVIDGKHRMKACVILGIDPITQEYDGEDALSYVVSANLARRHLSSSQKAIIAAKFVTTKAGNNQWDESEEVSTEKVAKAFGVSKRQVSRGRKVVEDAAPVVKELVETGVVSVDDAADISKETVEKQIAAVKKIITGEASTLRSGANMADKEELKNNPPPLPENVYRTVVMDPPWPMSKLVTSITKPTETDIAYPTMELDEIRKIDVRRFLNKNSHLFVWTTQKHLAWTIKTVEQWGLYHIFTMVWHKPGGMKMDNYPYYNGEFIVVAKMGMPKFVDTKNFPTVFNAPRGAHSEKPEEFYEILRRVTAEPRLDMFNRRPIDGFTAWGNESEEE